MSTPDVLYFFIVVLASGLLFVAWRAVAAYVKFRGARLVSCPETAEPAGVKIDATHAAISDVIGIPDLRLKSCSRWPERQDCGQECIAQIQASPEGCLVRTILTKWYEGKSCVYCGRPLSNADSLQHKPALMSPDRVTFEWNEIRAETIPAILATHMPVCWNCHIAESFRRLFPHLVLDRPSKPGTGLRR